MIACIYVYSFDTLPLVLFCMLVEIALVQLQFTKISLNLFKSIGLSNYQVTIFTVFFRIWVIVIFLKNPNLNYMSVSIYILICYLFICLSIYLYKSIHWTIWLSIYVFNFYLSRYKYITCIKVYNFYLYVYLCILYTSAYLHI